MNLSLPRSWSLNCFRIFSTFYWKFMGYSGSYRVILHEKISLENVNMYRNYTKSFIFKYQFIFIVIIFKDKKERKCNLIV